MFNKWQQNNYLALKIFKQILPDVFFMFSASSLQTNKVLVRIMGHTSSYIIILGVSHNAQLPNVIHQYSELHRLVCLFFSQASFLMSKQQLPECKLRTPLRTYLYWSQVWTECNWKNSELALLAMKNFLKPILSYRALIDEMLSYPSSRFSNGTE